MVVAETGGARERIAEQLQFLSIVCMAFVVGVGFFAFVAWFLADSAGLGGGPEMPRVVAYAGVLVGLGLLIAAPLAQRRMLERATVTMRSDERLDTALESYRLATLLSFMLREGAAVVGLMLTVLTDEPMWCYVLAAATLVAMFVGWPRREEIEEIVARA